MFIVRQNFKGINICGLRDTRFFLSMLSEGNKKLYTKQKREMSVYVTIGSKTFQFCSQFAHFFSYDLYNPIYSVVWESEDGSHGSSLETLTWGVHVAAQINWFRICEVIWSWRDFCLPFQSMIYKLDNESSFPQP